MRVFISYASEDRSTAEQLHYALTGAGHETFFDRADIEGSADYNQLLRTRIQRSDALVFLISPHSVAPGKYTLTELRWAEDQWRHPRGRVLPVLLGPVPMTDIPGYLKAVSILEPKGNLVAEVATAVAQLPGLQGASIAFSLRSALTQPLVDCARFLLKPGQYLRTHTQGDPPLAHAVGSATVLFAAGLLAAIAIGAAQQADASSSVFLTVGTVAMWLGYAMFLHVFLWLLGARRGLPYTVSAYLYVMGFLQPVFVWALFLVSVFVPDAVTHRTVEASFGGSGAASVFAQGRLFGGDAVAYFRLASGLLILGYFAVAAAAAHRIAVWRGIVASIASFLFFTVGFFLLYVFDSVAGAGIITRLLRG
jgi:hypothetical protein